MVVSISCSKLSCPHSKEGVCTSQPNFNTINTKKVLKSFRLKKPKNLIMGHLNINSLRNKFEYLKPIISPIFDIFLVSETKLDDSFPNNQFSLNGYKMFRRDRNGSGGGLCIYVKETIAAKQLNLHLDIDNEAIFLEINIRSRKWLIVGLYKPPIQNNSLFLESMSKNISQYLDSYGNITSLGDFNMTLEDKNLQNFTHTFSLDNLINEPTAFKGNPHCIDLILTNRKCYLKNTCVTETGISDFHKLTAVSLKSHVLKSPPKVKHFRNYKSFDENAFNEDLKSRLDSTEKLEYPLFESIFIDVLNTHAPIKTKTVRANHHQFMNKALRKAIMTRSRLINIYLKTRNNENWDKYKKQGLFCTNLLRKTKNDYFRCLNINDLNNNKKFWKKVKPFFLDKGLETNNIILKAKDELITYSSTLANLFNNYFINITNTLKLKKSPSKFQSLSKLLTIIFE